MRQNTRRETVGSRLEQTPMAPPCSWCIQRGGPQEKENILRCRLAARGKFDGKHGRIATLFRVKCMPHKITLAICHIDWVSSRLSITSNYVLDILRSLFLSNPYMPPLHEESRSA